MAVRGTGIFLLLVLAGALGCTSKEQVKFHLRPYTEQELPNGLKVLLIEDYSLPYFSLQMFLKTGYAVETAEDNGVSHMVAGLLDRGTKKRDAQKIADELAQIGLDFSAGVDLDYTVLSLSGLSQHKKAILNNFAELVTAPQFDPAEVERIRHQMVSEIQQQVDQPSELADLAFQSFLFGSHPYALAHMGTAASVKGLKRKQIIQHYLRYYRPNNAILAVVGQFQPDVVAELTEVFKEWKSRETPNLKRNAAPTIQGREVRLVHKGDLEQAQIRLGHLGIARNNDEFLRARLANMILGRGFSSRLVDQIRDNKGLTYSISSDMDARRDPGPFEISTFTRHDKIAETLQETLKIYEEFQTNGVTKEEVAAAKGYLYGLFPAALETAEKLAYNLMILRIYGVSDDYLSKFYEKVGDISVDDVNETIKKYFHPDKLKILIYANKKQALDQLKFLGNVDIKDYETFLR